MSIEKKSLQANESEILAALPENFHADFKNQLTTMSDENAPQLTGDAEIAAIKAELKANPAVDENAAAAELTNIEAPKPVIPATDAEIATEKAELLKQHKQ
ncbi:hypothetical protein [Dokdonia sp.]|uniref:hypothetical protein n=1 Tax=Dokdonia sp. TaxID=2024995 RepID=UPI003266D3C2